MQIPSHRRILIVDDTREIHLDFHKILAPPARSDSLDAMESAIFGSASKKNDTECYELVSAYQGAQALEAVQDALKCERPFALAFVDMRMPPGWDGLETIEKLWQADPELQVVICSAYSERSREEIIERTGRTHRLVILKKPFDVAEIAQLACAMTEKWRASRQANMKVSELESLVAERTAEISRAKHSLELSEQRYALAARGAKDGLWDWNIGSEKVFYSARWRAIAGLTEQWSGDSIADWLDRIHPHDRPPVDEAIAQHLSGLTDHLEFEHRLRRPDGSYVWTLCRGLAVRDPSGHALRIAGSLTDITRRKDTEDQLRRGAYYDRLTGLPNRALLRECLERAGADFRADPSRCFGVLFLDFDRFKDVNDSLGHLAGDQLLVAIAGRLTSCLSSLRIKDHTLARLGGDEFVILLRGISDPSAAITVCDGISRAMNDQFSIRDQPVHTSCSIGIALAAPDSSTPDDILRDADTAMYHAKSAGRSGYAVFDASMRERALARLRLENDLRRAIESNRIEVAYQPIVCLRTARVHGFEALARWTHPHLGPIGPDRFIPIAEETGLVIPLGDSILRIACRDLHSLQNLDPRWSNLTVNVNLSGRQFAHAPLVDSIAAIIADSRINPGTLALEVTETIVMDEFESAAAAMHRLRAMGVDMYMDDFGTGYSSLSCLKSLPLSGLKLDRSFVGQMESGSATPAIIHAVVTLASHLRLSVVAEGVETKAQLAGIMSLDCDRAQGYLFGKPMRLPELTSWLRQNSEEARLAA